MNGLVVRVFIDGSEKLSYQYLPRYIDGVAYGLNMGLVGVGSNNARGTFDDFVVQSLPPTTTYESTDDFATGPGGFTGEKTGTWIASGGRYTGTASSTAAAISVLPMPVRPAGDTAVDIDAARQARCRRRRAASSSTTTTPATSSS